MAMGMSGWFGGGWRGARGRAMRSPAQVKNQQHFEQMRVDKVVSEDDAQYDHMTEQERLDYYVNPGALTKMKKFLKGH